ncbi:MAG: cupredoxin domain-containing protein [Candidatus Jorgensenbacteria bacterium]
MSGRQVIILVAVVVIVVAAVVVGVFVREDEGPAVPGEEENGSVSGISGGEEAPDFTSETPVNAELTEAAVEAPAAPGAQEKFGAFNMTVGVAGFNPDSITVGKGDVVQIRLTAQGGNYDFSMPYNGLYVAVKSGEMKQITFGINTEGTYSFMCRDFCPAGKTISGQLIVLP